MSINLRLIIFIIVGIILLVVLVAFRFIAKPTGDNAARAEFFAVESIDTMKYSRDLAREKLKDNSFDAFIYRQVDNIAKTGASHIAIATPYDEEFIPILTRWTQAARKHGLKIWFRGNFSGWEGWFGYSRIGRDEHKAKTKLFLEQHAELFEDGDIFTPCPECENGGPGDPRMNGDVVGHREFLIEEYAIAKQVFTDNDKKVMSNYNSMNGDVARLVMDKETTKALDGIVVIDHYVRTTSQLASDIESIAENSGGRVVLGEFGVPIPDIHGAMDQTEQAQWLEDALRKLAPIEGLVGINYWTNMGGSTELWDTDGNEKEAVAVIEKYYNPLELKGRVIDGFGRPIKNVTVKTSLHKTQSNEDGYFRIPDIQGVETVTISAEGFISKQISTSMLSSKAILLEKANAGVLYRISEFFVNNFSLYN